MRRRLLLVLGFAVFVAFAYVAVDNVLLRPFPFAHVAYVGDEFTAPPSAFTDATGVDLRIPLPPDILGAARSKMAGVADDEKIQAITKTVRQLVAKSQGTEIRGINDIFSPDPRFMNICSEAAKMAAVLAQSVGYVARVVWMDGHTVTELHDGAGWFVMDTYGDVMFRDDTGRALSLVDLRRVPSARPERILQTEIPAMPEYVVRDKLTANAEKFYHHQWLYVVLAGKDLFTFQNASRNPWSVLESALGLEAPRAAQLDTGRRVGNVGVNFYTRVFDPR